MANCLFKVASMMGIARTRGVACYLGEKTSKLDGFVGPFPSLKPQFHHTEVVVAEASFGRYDSDIVAHPAKIMRIARYIQSPKYFDHIADDVK